MTQEEKKEFSIIPYPTNVIQQAEEYCIQMHLPPEAVSAVLRALDNNTKLISIIRQQQALPMDKRKALVDTKTPLADAPMQMIDDFVEMHLVPYTAMTWVEGHPYPKADGLRYKLMADTRIVKSVVTKPIEAPPLVDQNNMMVGYECVIEFFNGETYYAHGFADLAELQARRTRSNVSPGFMAMIAETRSKRRCILAALGLPTGVAEEVEDGTEYEAVSRTAAKMPATKVEPAPSVPTNLAQLLALAYTELHLSAQDISKRLGALGQITDYGAAWGKLKEGQK